MKLFRFYEEPKVKLFLWLQQLLLNRRKGGVCDSIPTSVFQVLEYGEYLGNGGFVRQKRNCRFPRS